MSAPEEREQNWYPASQVGWFTVHIREGIAVTGHQLELLQLGLAGNAGHRQLLERFLRWRLLRHL